MPKADRQAFEAIMYMDAGYDYPLMGLFMRARGYLDHIRSRGEKKPRKSLFRDIVRDDG
ncbi:hypothetical protein ccbrp13_59970 [Ktedonobacteria bacterium brp13]|nr:hypothetical protein ccbrp13_59970 [Ktedonobacteria bacterium brp13]